MFDESSSVRSNHCSAAVISGLLLSDITNRASPVARSHRIGFRLYAMADDPTCSASNGSSTCFIPASSRTSLQNLWTLAATPARSAAIWASTFRG